MPDTQIAYRIVLNTWTFLHKYMDNPPCTDKEWQAFVDEYQQEASKCFKNGQNEADGYADNYNEQLADFRLKLFVATFNLVKNRQEDKK